MSSQAPHIGCLACGTTAMGRTPEGNEHFDDVNWLAPFKIPGTQRIALVCAGCCRAMNAAHVGLVRSLGHKPMPPPLPTKAPPEETPA